MSTTTRHISGLQPLARFVIPRPPNSRPPRSQDPGATIFVIRRGNSSTLRFLPWGNLSLARISSFGLGKFGNLLCRRLFVHQGPCQSPKKPNPELTFLPVFPNMGRILCWNGLTYNFETRAGCWIRNSWDEEFHSSWLSLIGLWVSFGLRRVSFGSPHTYCFAITRETPQPTHRLTNLLFVGQRVGKPGRGGKWQNEAEIRWTGCRGENQAQGSWINRSCALITPPTTPPSSPSVPGRSSWKNHLKIWENLQTHVLMANIWQKCHCRKFGKLMDPEQFVPR